MLEKYQCASEIGIAETPLHLAIENGRAAVVRLLVDKGAQLAVRTITKGREVEEEGSPSFFFDEGCVAIDMAARKRDIEKILEGTGQKLWVASRY